MSYAKLIILTLLSSLTMISCKHKNIEHTEKLFINGAIYTANEKQQEFVIGKTQWGHLGFKAVVPLIVTHQGAMWLCCQRGVIPGKSFIYQAPGEDSAHKKTRSKTGFLLLALKCYSSSDSLGGSSASPTAAATGSFSFSSSGALSKTPSNFKCFGLPSVLAMSIIILFLPSKAP